MRPRFKLGLVVLLAICCISQLAEAAPTINGLPDGVDSGSEYLFGYSFNQANTLTLTFSSGGPIVLSTQFGGVNHTGWWSPTEGNNTSNDNYIVGDLSNDGTQLYNDFFSFALGNIPMSAIVTSATLSIQRFSGGSSSGLLSEPLSFFDVFTDLATLDNKSAGPNAAIFNDLGSGTNYGNFNVTIAGSSTDVLDFGLNSSAISDINAAIANAQPAFSIGGTLTPSAVPEPASLVVWSLFIAVCGGATWWRRRKR